MFSRGKAFFSEEKNQKTFFCCGRAFIKRRRTLNSQKSFASFLQKRSPALLAGLLLAGVPVTGSAANAKYPRATPIIPLGGKLSSVESAVSPDGRHIAFDERPVRKSSTPDRFSPGRLIVTDRSGRILLSTADVLSAAAGRNCWQIDNIEWIDNVRLGVRCAGHVFNRYGIVPLATGKAETSYDGLGFYWSPDRRQIAHLTYGDAVQVMIGDKIVSGTPDRTAGYEVSDVAWSPDSRHIAFIDTKSKSLPTPAANGASEFGDPHAYLVVAAANAAPMAVAAAGCTDVTPDWPDSRHIQIACGAAQRTLAIGGAAWAPFNAK
jgi:hypothetical protein